MADDYLELDPRDGRPRTSSAPVDAVWAFKPYFDDVLIDTVGSTKQKAMVNALREYAHVLVTVNATMEDVERAFEDELSSYGNLVAVNVTEVYG